MTTTLQFETRDECPACGKSEHVDAAHGPLSSPEMEQYFRIFYGDDVDLATLGDAQYHLVKCSHCATYFQVQVLTPADMEVLYEDWIDPEASYQKIRSNFDTNPLGLVNQVLRFKSLLAMKPSEAWVLDFGCGWGVLLDTARSMGYNVAGVELSPTRLAFMKERGITTYEKASDAGRKFDFVNCSQVLEHVSNPLEILLAIKEVCAPGAIVHIATPDSSKLPDTFELGDFSLNGEFNPQLGSVIPLEHINGYSPASLITLAARAGLTLARQPSTEAVEVRGNALKVAYRIARTYGKQLAYKLNRTRTTDLYFRA